MKYLATGVIHPERAGVWFSRIEMKFQSGGHAAVSCEAAHITVTLEDPKLDGWIAAHIRAEDVANIVVGALGLAHGAGYSVEIVQVTEEDGTPHVFGVKPQGEKVEETLELAPTQEVFVRAYRLSGRDIFFRLAVQDYLRAITDVADCATYCYRAIEGIKSSFVLHTGQDRWEAMHAALGTNREEIEAAVKRYADPVRHGNWVNAVPTNSAQRWKMVRLTRDIIRKYLDHAESAT